MAAQQNFRTAFNGFHREDVVHYIEYLNSRHTAEINQLKSELEFLRSKDKTDNAESQVSPAALQELEEALDALRTEKEALEGQLAEAAAGEVAAKAQAESLAEERDQLRAQLADALKNQESVKSRMEEELQAYRRAERAERLAKERVEQMYNQANGIIANATVKVDSAAAQIGLLSDNVMEQLAQLRQAVSGSNDALKEAATSMYALRPEHPDSDTL